MNSKTLSYDMPTMDFPKGSWVSAGLVRPETNVAGRYFITETGAIHRVGESGIVAGDEEVARSRAVWWFFPAADDMETRARMDRALKYKVDAITREVKFAAKAAGTASIIALVLSVVAIIVASVV